MPIAPRADRAAGGIGFRRHWVDSRPALAIFRGGSRRKLSFVQRRKAIGGRAFAGRAKPLKKSKFSSARRCFIARPGKIALSNEGRSFYACVTDVLKAE